MVRWYHLILSAYGFWLPNDPRGSWSDFVGAWELLKFGGPTTVTTKRSYAHDPHDRSLRFQAKNSLKYPPVRFNDQQRQAIAQGFGHAIIDGSYHIHACCIGHDHAHLVVARHERSIEAISKHLKSKSSMALRSSICHPLAAYAKNNSIPTPWAEGCWSVFISDFEHLSQAVDYVRRHPAKEGLPPQNWDFTIPIPV